MLIVIKTKKYNLQFRISLYLTADFARIISWKLKLKLQALHRLASIKGPRSWVWNCLLSAQGIHLTVVNRNCRVKCSNIYKYTDIMYLSIWKEILAVKWILEIMFRNVLIILPFKNGRYLRRRQRLKMTSVETL